MKKRIIALILAISTIISLPGCNGITAKTLSDGVQAGQVEVGDTTEKHIVTNSFALDLFKKCLNEEGNTLISPLSVLCALSMTANGAKGETLAQMEEVLGLSVEELNECIYVYRNSLPDEKKCKVNLSNSIWFTDHIRFTPNEEFLQRNADYYGAEIFEAPFDNSTVRDINEWISTNTDGMIQNMIKEIPASAIMYLINALTFDAEWSDIYEDYQIRGGKFTKEDGTTRYVDYMHSQESYYLESGQGIGVMKHYSGAKCAFVALLPKEGMTVKDYLDTLTGEELEKIFENVQNIPVETQIPKFESTYELSMVDILREMGMMNAFDIAAADFSGLGTSEGGNIYMNEVLHKAYITVDGKGTKAGAVTIVVTEDGAALEIIEPKKVILDRPFVYMIVDLENELPLFMGTLMDFE